MHRLVVATLLSGSALIAGLAPPAAFAATDAARVYGPFHIIAYNAGSCSTATRAQIWANDAVTATYTVQHNANGSWNVRFDFAGTFTSFDGRSPGACETTSPHGTVIRNGMVGTLIGYYDGTVPGGTFDPEACKDPPEPCDESFGFVAVSFSQGAKYTCATVNCLNDSEYAATSSPEQRLEFRHWRNFANGPGPETYVGDIANE